MNNTMNKQVYEEASEWLVELRVDEDVDASTRERLDAWFRESPHHIRAFLELSSIWEDGSDPDLDRRNSTDALIVRARAATNVVRLEPGEREARKPREDSTHVHRSVFVAVALARILSWRSVLTASLMLACLTTGLGVLYHNLSSTYATQTGEQRSIRLRDGSQLTLNSRSRIRVRYSERERDVDLLEGQALFQVAKDPARPFVVRSGSTRVRAVGTLFDVYRKTAWTTVTVVEGRVAVLPVLNVPGRPLDRARTPDIADSGDSGAILVSAGDQVTVTPSAVTQPTHANVAVVTAWTQRELVFDLTPLPDVIQEFNRYNVRQMIVSDAKLNDFHVTGVLSTTDPASFLRFLRAQPGISVEETDREIRISKK
jgi:transmembrane sensor